MTSDRPKLWFILGCTACGKSAVGYELARAIGAEIIVVDSMKIYRRMDIGTAKPPTAHREQVPYHLIDVVEPSESFNVAQYVTLADEAIQQVHREGRPILCVGGTGLYIKTLSHGLFEGPGEDAVFRDQLRAEAQQLGIEALHQRLLEVDPQAGERIHRNDYRRIERALEVYYLTGTPITQLQSQWRAQSSRYDCRFLGLRRSKEEQNQRINARVKRMMAADLLEEVQRLCAEDRPLSPQASQALGYAELIAHLEGRWSLEEAVEQIKINTRRFGKAQRTWFRHFREAQWLDIAPDEPADSLVARAREAYEAGA